MGTRSTVAAVLAGVCLIVLPATPVRAATADPVTRWAERQAVPLHGVAPDAAPSDLEPLRAAVGHAEIVGLGEAAHQLAEITTLKHRTVRYLVEELGFRSIAWEEDWSLGTLINDYVLGRRDDRDALVAQMSRVFRNREVADVLTWLREYNRTHRDQVRFTGVEYFATRPLAYDAVETYLRRAAPATLPAAREHLRVIRPCTDDMGAYLRWFLEVDDKDRYVGSATALYDLVAAVPHRTGDRGHALALQHARQIRSFYTAFSMPDNTAYRDARAAENVHWWHRYSRDKIVYWAASAHTADVAELRLTRPGQPDATFASAGSYLRDWYGDRYRSIGFTFDRGEYEVEPGQRVPLPPPAGSWFERPLGAVRHDQFLLDLRRPVPAPVREWLHRPLVTRGVPEAGHGSTMSGGTPAGWFDLLVHRQEVSPAGK
jgi:erythromycin esterase